MCYVYNPKYRRNCKQTFITQDERRKNHKGSFFFVVAVFVIHSSFFILTTRRKNFTYFSVNFEITYWSSATFEKIAKLFPWNNQDELYSVMRNWIKENLLMLGKFIFLGVEKFIVLFFKLGFRFNKLKFSRKTLKGELKCFEIEFFLWNMKEWKTTLSTNP